MWFCDVVVCVVSTSEHLQRKSPDEKKILKRKNASLERTDRDLCTEYCRKLRFCSIQIEWLFLSRTAATWICRWANFERKRPSYINKTRRGCGQGRGYDGGATLFMDADAPPSAVSIVLYCNYCTSLKWSARVARPRRRDCEECGNL